MSDLSLGTHLRSRREEVRISQATLAWVARVSRNTVSNLERDAVAEPDERVIDNVEAALGLDRWYRYSLDLGEKPPNLAEPRIVHRLIEVIEQLKDEDPKRARDAADVYIAFMGALRDAQDDDSRLSFHQALQEEAGRLAAHILPLLQVETELDASTVAFLEDQGWSPEDTSNSGGSTARVTVRTSATDAGRMAEAARVHIGATEAEARLHAELDELRAALRAAEMLRERAEVREFGTNQRLMRAEIQAETAHEHLARMHDQLREVLAAPAEAAKIYGRLPEDVQDALRSGWIVDRSIIESPAVPGLRHIVLTVRPDQVTHLNARDMADAVNRMEFALVVAQRAVEHLKRTEWKSPDLDAVLEGLRMGLRNADLGDFTGGPFADIEDGDHADLGERR